MDTRLLLQTPPAEDIPDMMCVNGCRAFRKTAHSAPSAGEHWGDALNHMEFLSLIHKAFYGTSGQFNLYFSSL